MSSHHSDWVDEDHQLNWDEGSILIWMMKEYGVVASWSKIFILKGTLRLSRMQLLENGHIFYFLHDVHLHSPATKKYTKLQDQSSGIYPIVHNPGFASLKYVVGVGSRLSTRQLDIKMKIIKTLVSHLIFCELPKFRKLLVRTFVICLLHVIFIFVFNLLMRTR